MRLSKVYFVLLTILSVLSIYLREANAAEIPESTLCAERASSEGHSDASTSEASKSETRVTETRPLETCRWGTRPREHAPRGTHRSPRSSMGPCRAQWRLAGFLSLPEFAIALNTKADEANAKSLRKKGEGKEEKSPFLNFDTEAEIEKASRATEDAVKAGQFEQALEHAKKALELSESSFGKLHSKYASALNNLAWVEQNTGDFASARLHFEQAQSIVESQLGKDSPELLNILNNLSMLMTAEGDPQHAIPLLERALTLEEKNLGQDSPYLANTLNNLAVTYEAASRHDDSMRVLERAYKIQQTDAEGSDFSEKSLTLTNLALDYNSSGKPLRARELMNEALELRENNLKPGDLDISETLNNLAKIELSCGLPSAARQHLEQALLNAHISFSDDSIDIVGIINNLVKIDLLGGRAEEAEKLSLQAAYIVDKHVSKVFPGLSFAEQRSFLNTKLPEQISILVSATRNAQDASAEYSFLFRWKGLLIDALRRQSQLNALSKDSQYGAEIKELIALRSKFTALYHQAGKKSFDEWKQASDELLSKKERLERSLNANLKNGSVVDVLAGMDLKQFCGLLKADECLVDVYNYRVYKKEQGSAIAGGGAGGSADSKYVAYILDSAGGLRMQDLGSAVELNSVIKNWVKHTVSRKEDANETSWIKSRLDTLQLSTEKKVFVCPDAEINRLPLSIFLKQSLLTHLDAPRELAYLRITQAKTNDSSHRFLGVGGVDFGKQGGTVIFHPLPGTLAEVQAVGELAGKNGYSVIEFHGEDATKKHVLAELPGAEMVHLATHGFFSETGFAEKVYSLDVNDAERSAGNLVNSRDPLAKSGIVLAQPQGDSKSDEQTQILSAEEMVSCDLHNCRSMVLSACETGLGDKDNGQGVLGLRASVMAAGARRLLISLWRVPDDATVAFMKEFYQNVLVKKESPAEAVKNAQSVVASYEEFSKTAEWGAWVLVGEGW